MRTNEVRGVCLGDVYRDQNGDLWEVVTLCTDPTATVRRVDRASSLKREETHVIGCLNWMSKWRERLIPAPVAATFTMTTPEGSDCACGRYQDEPHRPGCISANT